MVYRVYQVVYAVDVWSYVNQYIVYVIIIVIIIIINIWYTCSATRKDDGYHVTSETDPALPYNYVIRENDSS